MNGLGSEILRDLINLVFSLYIFIVMLRFLLQLARANFFNPLSQAIVRLTNPPLKPLRRIIPGLWGIDLASVVLMLALKILELGLLVLVTGYKAGIGVLVIVALAELVRLAIYIFMGAIIIRIVLSWVNPASLHPANPAGSLVTSLSEPLMGPARRLLPPISGFDFSPILVIFLLSIALKILGRLVGG